MIELASILGQWYNQQHLCVYICPGFSWDRVNFPLSSCCILDL